MFITHKFKKNKASLLFIMHVKLHIDSQRPVYPTAFYSVKAIKDAHLRYRQGFRYGYAVFGDTVKVTGSFQSLGYKHIRCCYTVAVH